jgi:hypothetical protein
MARAVNGPRFLAPLDAAQDGSISDLHDHVVHGGFVRQRKGIDRLDLLVTGIFEVLRNIYAGKESADFSPYICVAERTQPGPPTLIVHDVKGTLGHGGAGGCIRDRLCGRTGAAEKK